MAETRRGGKTVSSHSRTRFSQLAGFALGFVLFGQLFSSITAAATITTFDAPGDYTGPLAINRFGDVGGYCDGGCYGIIQHGFLRTADGTITTLDPASGSVVIAANGIDDLGQVAGHWRASPIHKL